MEIYQIRYFLAAAETGSFTRAADRVHVTQPTLSAGIRKLEENLNAILFERQARRTVLTPAGNRFLDRAKTIMAECERARTELSSDDRTSALRIGVLPSVPGGRLGELLATFTKAYSHIAVEVLEGDANRLDQWMDQERIDLALTSSERDTSPRPPEIGQTPLFRQNMVLGMSLDHPLSRRQTLRPRDLADQAYILRQHCPYVRPLNTYFTERNIRPNVICRTRQETRALTLVAAGLGVTILPDTMVWPGLFTRALEGLNMQSTVALMWRVSSDGGDTDLFRTFASSHDWKATDSEDGSSTRLNWAH